jgi:UDP-N-acetylmuramate--alanine ligase
MSALAIVLHQWGHDVSGSDVVESRIIENLRDMGIPIEIGHSESHVVGVEIVTYSTAIPADNIEIQHARVLGATVLHRGDVLGSMCATRRSIGVAGTHGKTTTSAVLMHIFQSSAEDVSYVIGAEVRNTGTGARAGSSDLLIVEMDESDGTAEVIPVEGLVITNIDVDHLDYFGNESAIRDTFTDIVLNATGPIVVCMDDENCREVLSRVSGQKEVLTYGFSPESNICITSFTHTPDGIGFQVHHKDGIYDVEVPLRGRHNALNCTAALAMTLLYGYSLNESIQALKSFQGVERRFEERTEVRGALLIDDYAHLPAEISAVLTTARNHPRRTGKLIAVFQPNRFHRVAQMADDFSECFTEADLVVITDIYASGTVRIEGITGERIVNAVRTAHPDSIVVWAPTRQDVITSVLENLSAGDVCLSMGCGDIGNLPDEIAAEATS